MTTPIIQRMSAISGLCLLCLSPFAIAGYDIHISRKPFWADEGGPKITFEEWLRCVKSDPQIVKDPINGPDDFMVTLAGGGFPLWYRADLGELYTKDPSESAMLKLQRIAGCLKARVQGDDGEFYPSGH